MGSRYLYLETFTHIFNRAALDDETRLSRTEADRRSVGIYRNLRYFQGVINFP